MSLDTRCSALTKRAEQLKRWEESDTNREPAHPKNLTGRKIKFSSGCVFLAACIAGDKDEVVRLINEGADINTANVDGLTALHQACIDDNLEMVEFLVQNKADVNRQDNEGWTPLHATASCGFNSIARYLIESGADLAAINSDGDLCIDLAASDSMEDLLQKFIEEQNIDCEAARESEKRLMLEDAKKWLRSDASEADRPHPRTGATALHVAAAKGYTKVLSLLLAGRADVDKQDNDGWTPLHAAAHWGQKEAAQMLVTSLADMDVKNYAGQTPIDIAHKDSVRFLDDLKKNNRRTKRKPIQKNNDNMGNHTDTPPKVIRVEVQTDKLTEEEAIKFLEPISESDNTSTDDSENDTDSTESSHSTSISEEEVPEVPIDSKTKPPSDPMGQKSDKAIIEDEAPWRRANSLRTRTQIDSPPKNNVPEKETPPTDSEVILRRTQSFENDDKFYQKYRELQARIKANSCPVLPATQINNVVTGGGGVGTGNTTNNYIVQRSASLKDSRVQLARNKINNWPPNASAETTATTTTTTVTTPATTPSAAQVRSPIKSQDDTNVFMQQRYGSTTSLPYVNNDIHNSGKYGGSELNLSSTNDANSRIIPPSRNAASISNLNEMKPSQAAIVPPKLPPKSVAAAVAPPTIQEQPPTPPTVQQMAPPPPPPTKLSPGNFIKNFFKSFVPPARDEESETQRKAHAKRVRETRRSTQGVTLDEFKSAEEFVKKKNMNNNNNNTNSDNPTSSTSSSTTTTTTTTTPTTTSTEVNDRVPATNIDDAVSITATIVEQPKSDTVSASYTITAPSSDKQHQQQSYSDKTSASYTIPSSKTVSKEKSPNTDDEKSITATINVPSSNAVTKKTEEVEMSRVAGESGGNRSQKNSVSDDGGGVISERGSRDKRSLFDIDNASSLTLAEKLRNEANKYQEVSKSNTDVSQNSAAGDVIAYRKSSDSTPPSPAHQHVATSAAERRPSWRLKFDAGNKSFKLEDATSQNAASTAAVSPPAATDSTAAPSVQRRHNYTSNPSAPVGIATQPSVAANNTAPTRPISAPVISTASSDDKLKNNNTTPVGNDVTYIRRLKNEEDKENDKENDSRTGQATQAVIQRRRRPKRRSTGVQRFDKDDLDPDRQESPGDGDDKESGSEISTRSRLGSTNSITSDLRNDDNESGENGDFIDYKALWEASKLENDKLKMQMKKRDEDLTTARATLDRFTNATTKNSLSEIEKRERRAMERKMSEMEEELKQLEPLRTENQRLKDENGALIRVISKLSK